MSGCSTLNSAANSVTNFMTGGSGKPPPGTPGYVSGFLGGVATDEPRAALIGREVLSGGGSAADAAVAAAFMLAVTLPSRAGLGGGGACMVYDPDKSSINGGVPEALVFLPPAGGGSGPRPAAVPMLARGLFALHARYGHLPFESIIAGAEQGARFGLPVSRALARDLAVVAGPLGGDPVARSLFLQPNGQPLPEGAPLVQTDLGATLAQIRVAGVGDLYNGALARRLVDAASVAGGGLTLPAMRDALPRFAPAITVAAPRGDKASFLPPPADGGLAAAAAFQALAAAPGDLERAQNRALAVAAAWRAQGGAGDPAALLAGPVPVQPASLPPLPASAGLVTLDPDGRVVACSFTMNNLFGTGRVAPGTGILLGASPSWMPPPLLAAGIAWNPNTHAFHAAVAASGQEGAPLAVADLLSQALVTRSRVLTHGGSSMSQSAAMTRNEQVTVTEGMPLRAAPEPGRADVISCPGYLPGDKSACGWSVDPRSAGLATGSN
jgi:gamma-glutamyltranspeptidase/glutathione hydrolase